MTLQKKTKLTATISICFIYYVCLTNTQIIKKGFGNSNKIQLNV
jgi:hypothetical protein